MKIYEDGLVTYKSSVTVTSKICPAVVGLRGVPINVPFEVCDDLAEYSPSVVTLTAWAPDQ